MAAIENTGAGGEGNIDPSTNFMEWLQSKGAKQALIDKMLAMDMDSIEVLREIDIDDPEAIKQISKELNLSYAQTCKFKAIVRSLPNSKLNVMIDPDERKAILRMKDKLKQIELSITNIDECKKNIQNEVQQCTKLISTTYDNIAQIAIQRKETLLIELKSIADNKINELNEQYEIMKKNSTSTSLQINTCYGKINKKIDLMQMEQRKQNILKTAETVNNLVTIEKDNKLVTDYNIDFVCDSNKVINAINHSGHFASVPIPLVVSLQVRSGGLDIKWKLKDNDDQKRNDVNKLNVEWSYVEIKDDEKYNIDDLKDNWNHSKIFNVNNIDNNNNEIHIDLKNQIGTYFVRLQCMINNKCSKLSNSKSISIKIFAPAPKFSFTNNNNANVGVTENGTRIKSLGTGCQWESVASSTGWNSGKRFWKMRANSNGHSNGAGAVGFGVTTNHANAGSAKQILELGGKYIYYHYLSSQTAIYRNINGSTVSVNNTYAWKNGKVLTVTLDCEGNKISFDINDEHVGTYDIEANQTYYPIMQICGCLGHDYKLLQ